MYFTIIRHVSEFRATRQLPGLTGDSFRIQIRKHAKIKPVTETTTQLYGLTTGDFDIIHFVETHMLPEIEQNPETKIFTNSTSLALVVTLNHARPR